MSMGKRCAIILLAVVNFINTVAGVIVDYKLISGEKITSILPFTQEMSSVQRMLVDFMSVALIITLIAAVTTYLVTDVPYTPLEIMENFAGVFMAVPVIILGFGIYGAVQTPLRADRPWIIAAFVIYTVLYAVNISCILTVKEDE